MIRKSVIVSLLIIASIITVDVTYGARKKGKELVSQESEISAKEFKEDPLKDWSVGREFICVTDQLPTLLAQSSPFANKTGYLGKNFYYTLLTEQTTITGQTSYIIFKCEGEEFKCKVNIPIEKILTTDVYPLIPELVATKHIKNADNLLCGDRVYIKSNRWLNIDGETKHGRRYIPVTITSVEVGDKVLPIKITFVDDEGEFGGVYVSLSTNKSKSSFATFDKLFTYTDPRKNYPDLSDSVWDAVTNSTVKLGMTKEECRVALDGYPENVQKSANYSSLREVWIYDTGKRLIFTDGLLTEFKL